MNNEKPFVSVIIAALNEEAAIGKVVNAVPPTVANEIIVVDNGSPRNVATSTIRELCPEARIVSLPENRGYAGGLHAGACN